MHFNNNTTSCLLVGKNLFAFVSAWVIDGIPIDIVDKISYLGSEFGKLNGNTHSVENMHKATRAFIGLKGALQFSIMGYGFSIYITNKNINCLES